MKRIEVIDMFYNIGRLANLTKGKLENISMEFTLNNLATDIEENIENME